MEPHATEKLLMAKNTTNTKRKKKKKKDGVGPPNGKNIFFLPTAQLVELYYLKYETKGQAQTGYQEYK